MHKLSDVLLGIIEVFSGGACLVLLLAFAAHRLATVLTCLFDQWDGAIEEHAGDAEGREAEPPQGPRAPQEKVNG